MQTSNLHKDSPAEDLPTPFLRWAGGKQQLISKLREYLPPDARDRHYREPFLGAGSFFFDLSPTAATLSDANEQLIATYRAIARNWELIATYLKGHKSRTNENYYYDIRDLYNRSDLSCAQAARFIYLNKSCFNGIFRVNRAGEFNVPYGWKEPPALPSREALRNVARSLSRTELIAEKFEDALERANRGDFVYLDPPYPPLNGTAYFTHYTPRCFGVDDQTSVANWTKRLDEKGCLFLMTNADTPLIQQLYQGFHVRPLSVTRFVTCKSKKHAVRELVITNY